MPILMIALLAFLVFGLIGILLSAAVILERSKRKHTGDATHSALSGAGPFPNPPLR